MKTQAELVEEIVNQFVSDAKLFTALDVSNKVKEEFPFAKHREVREDVRDLYNTLMVSMGYTRTPIKVTLSDGSVAEALLYHSLIDSWDLDTKYSDQQRTSKQASTVASTPVVSTTTTTVSNPVTAVVAPTAQVQSSKSKWDQLFDTQPSLFPRK